MTAVSTLPGELDLFTISRSFPIANNGHVYAARSFGNSIFFYPDWTQIGDLYAPGNYVSAVSRSTDKWDIFVAGSDGQVWTTASGVWTTVPGVGVWWPLPGIHVLQGTQPHPLPMNSLFLLSTLMGTFKHQSGPRILEDGLPGGK
jgi:hypothetical protein